MDRLSIELVKGAKPYCLKTHRQIPLHLHETTKAALDKLEAKGIIVKHEGTSVWSHPMIVIPKNLVRSEYVQTLQNLNCNLFKKPLV